MIDAEDAARELDKAGDVLEQVHRYLYAMNDMNAGLHLAPTVRPSPLTVRVECALEEARGAAERFRKEDT